MPAPNLFLDSFNHYATADVFGQGSGQKWSGVGPGTSTGNLMINPGTGLHGNSLRIIIPSGSSNIYAWRQIGTTASNVSSVVLGFRFRISGYANNLILCGTADLNTGSPQTNLQLNADGTLSVITPAGTVPNGGKSSNFIKTNTWYYVELMVTISTSIPANSWMVNVNGVNWINVSAGINIKGSTNFVGQIYLGHGTGTAPTSNSFPLTIDYCDLYVDGGGAVNGGAFWGDTRVEDNLPIATGTYNTWNPANNFTAVGSVGNQYLYGTTARCLINGTSGNKVTFSFAPLSANPTSISCVQINNTTRKNNAGTRQITDYCRSVATELAGNTFTLIPSFTVLTGGYPTDPNTSAPWTAARLNAAEFGLAIV